MLILRRLFPLLLLSILPFASNASELYKWVDAEGRTHYGARPPADADLQPISGQISGYDAPRIVSPSNREASQAMADRQVILYSAEWCGICRKAASYFRKQGIPFTEYDVERSEKGRRDFQRLGGGGVPIILVGKQRMSGFSVATFERLYRGR